MPSPRRQLLPEDVTRVIICTPDKDLAQCVSGSRIVQLNRRTRVTLDEAGVIRKFGVLPESIPDYLALVGDAADGYPGLPGWGAKSSAAVLAKFPHLESIPKDCREWQVNAAGASALADTLCRERDRAVLFRRLVTLRTDIELFEDVEELKWRGPTPGFDELAARLDTARTKKRQAGEPETETHNDGPRRDEILSNRCRAPETMESVSPPPTSSCLTRLSHSNFATIHTESLREWDYTSNIFRVTKQSGLDLEKEVSASVEAELFFDIPFYRTH